MERISQLAGKFARPFVQMPHHSNAPPLPPISSTSKATILRPIHLLTFESPTTGQINRVKNQQAGTGATPPPTYGPSRCTSYAIHQLVRDFPLIRSVNKQRTVEVDTTAVTTPTQSQGAVATALASLLCIVIELSFSTTAMPAQTRPPPIQAQHPTARRRLGSPRTTATFN